MWRKIGRFLKILQMNINVFFTFSNRSLQIWNNTCIIMSHTSRRGIECPLALLGRNTPSLDTQTYHHPLSSSPLNPQVYQMSRKSPILQQEFEMYHLPNTQRIMNAPQPRLTRNHTQIDSLLSFHDRLSPVIERETHSYARWVTIYYNSEYWCRCRKTGVYVKLIIIRNTGTLSRRF